MIQFLRLITRIAIVPLLFGLPAAMLRGQTIAAPRVAPSGFEWRADFSAAGSAGIAEGSSALGDIRHHVVQLEGVHNRPVDGDTSVLVGASWKRFEFSGSRADVPESLTALALKLGFARTLSPRWSLRAEIDPGFYSDFEDISGDDFNAPFGIRAVYAARRELQWAIALFVDPRSSRPVIGGVGARWQFAEGWTLLALLPAPRVEYAVSPALSVFAGGLIRGGTFRVAENFGRSRGRPTLDHQMIDFRELNVGVGARWQVKAGVTLNAGIGWMIDRRFEFEDRDLLINGDGAPSLSVAVNGRF